MEGGTTALRDFASGDSMLAASLFPDPDEILAADDVVAGKYAIVRVLGRGGMGVVYEAMHQRLRQRVAIKTLRPRLMTTAAPIARFEREARTVSQLKSPNVVRVLDVDTLPSGVPYIVMEYLDGHDLAHELKARGRLPIGEAAAIVIEVCKVMSEAHEAGIVHRDLKPSNIFLSLSERGDRERRTVKVLDFGISKIADDAEASVTATEATIGTPMYMSPEQVRSSKHVDARTDVWALGVILYELLAGGTPFQGSPSAVAAAIVTDEVPKPSTFRAEIPAPLDALILRALERDPKARVQTVDELSAALSPFAQAGPLRVVRDFDRVSIGPESGRSLRGDETTRLDRPALPQSNAQTLTATTDFREAAPVTSTAPPRRRSLIVVAAVFAVASGGIFLAARLRNDRAPIAPSAPSETPAVGSAPTALATTPPATSSDGRADPKAASSIALSASANKATSKFPRPKPTVSPSQKPATSSASPEPTNPAHI